ncbi:MAG TPA: sulfur transferase domain-containing protein [Gaiellales bacterium]|nr:sulfur transferase domain-containing protein [Gaiellales bacterium]
MRRLDYARLSDTLLAGRMPVSTAHIDALAAEGVTAVINLCEDHEYWDDEREAVASACREHAIVERRLPVTDGATVPDAVLDRAVEAAAGGVTYVHCRGGRERSAAVAVAILAASAGTSVEEALTFACARRPAFRPLHWQLEGVRAWLRVRGARRILDA